MIPYPEQIEAVEVAYKRQQGIISVCTAVGKSLIIGLLIQKCQVKTLIIVPSLELKEQLSSTLKSWFGSLNNITIENIASSQLSKLTDFDCLIIDEAHHSAAKTYRTLNKKSWNKIFFRFFLTATPFRANSDENLLMQSITGPVIYDLPYRRAVELGYVCPVEAYYVELPPTEVNGNTWAQVYSQLVVNNLNRNCIIANLLINLWNNSSKALCLVKEIKHGDNIVECLPEAVVPFTNGEDEVTRHYIKEFKNGHIDCLIGTNGVLGEGVDTKPAEYVIIAGLGKSKNAFMQQVGRGLRLYPGKDSCKVIIFKDPSHKFTLRHFNAQVKILKEEYGIIPTKLNI